MTKRIDIAGKKFGRLTVIRATERRRLKHLLWECRCACGTQILATSQNIRTGVVKSCGCYRRDTSSTKFKKLNRKGLANGRAMAAKRREGINYVSSKDAWYKRCAGRYYEALRRGWRVGFSSAHSFAAYCKNIAPKKCPIFKKRLRASTTGFSPWSPSIDRINPKRGYVPGNIQIISLRANMIKRDLNSAELERFARWILR